MANKIEKISFMMKKFIKDVTRDRQIYQLADDIHSPELGEYYFIITEEQLLAGHSQQYQFDPQGIPVIPSYIDVAEHRMIYYPISIGQYGLAIWHSYLKTRSDADKVRFLNIADWFMKHGIEHDQLGVYWLTAVEKPAYRILKPWKSAFSQARAINILLRAHQITGNESYEKYAQLALRPFLFSVEQGGVAALTAEGPFYEEYPAAVPVLVLNGMIFALCGIYDFIRLHRDHELANTIYRNGVRTLVKLLPSYDMGFWSKYSLCRAEFHPAIDPATIGYHFLHIIQLELMFRLTDETIFREYVNRWRNYPSLKNFIRMYFIKMKALRKMNRL